MIGVIWSKGKLVFLLLILLIGVFLATRGQSVEEMDSEQIELIAELVAPEIGEDTTPEDDGKMSGAEQAGTLYAGLMCSIADPAFWEEFFADWEDQSEADRLDEAKKTELFYDSYGYPTELAGNTDVSIHWGDPEFVTAVKEKIADSGDCIVNITNNAGIILDDHLAGPRPEW